MSDHSNEYRVGYRRPPRHNRWKKGQSGNPQRRKRKLPESTLAIIDKLLVGLVPITLNGVTTKVPALEAIMLQLLFKAMAGSGRAIRVVIKYQEFASLNLEKKLTLAFVENEYTRSLATQVRGGNDG